MKDVGKGEGEEKGGDVHGYPQLLNRDLIYYTYLSVF